ncbi:hypothetical protein [Flexivirga oryzae]|uniref:Uncharacterized protein n=1 Tax=Flexivirga oryzae TaxID=1794944 RepID=A0A839NHV5_9MICO|nr:hypothetical protein [Flexivirga oryzae]MBB2894251.1 hypothetical protein [Flexivirga oryzae]
MRRIATTAWADGQTDWVEGTGNWVFWTDQSFEPTDATTPAWTFKGMDLLTGKVIELDHSDSWSSPTPIPRAANGYVVWYRAANRKGTTATVWTFTPKTGKKHKIGTGWYSFTTPAKGFVVFTRLIEPSSPSTKLMDVSLSSGQVRQIQGGPDATIPRTANGSDLLVWLAPSVNDAESVNWETGVSGRSTSLVEPAATMAVPGKNFVAFADRDGDLEVVNAANAHDLLTVTTDPVFVPCRVAAGGSTVAWCEQESSTRIMIRTVEVS